MSLKDTIQDAVESAFEALDDVPESCTYTQTTSSTYAPATGVDTPATNTQTGVPVVFDVYSTRDIDGERIRASDQKALIAANDIVVTPKVEDTITRADGTIWTVEEVATDPATAMWELRVRKP
jgi:hypothetical protein